MKMEKVLRSALLLLLAAALCLSMAACTQTPAESSPVSETQTPETAASEKASPEDDMPEDAGTEEAPAYDALSSALPVKTLRAKRVDENPYMAKSDANIHHDGYNTDSTDEVLPLGIYPEINVSYEKTNANASPAIYFDSYGHAVVPLLGGIAIRDLNAKETTTLGYFSPKQHDGGGYVIQSSYTFLDSENRIVCPTSNNHVLMLRATDEAGNILPEFEKVLDINIKAAAEAALGKTLEQNLLSVVFDYEGNLWFATGGFRIYPEREQQGVLGYIARSAIDAILSGEQTDLSDAVFVYELICFGDHKEIVVVAVRPNVEQNRDDLRHSRFKDSRFDIPAAELGNDAAVVLHVGLVESQHRAHCMEDRIIGAVRCAFVILRFKKISCRVKAFYRVFQPHL